MQFFIRCLLFYQIHFMYQLHTFKYIRYVCKYVQFSNAGWFWFYIRVLGHCLSVIKPIKTFRICSQACYTAYLGIKNVFSMGMVLVQYSTIPTSSSSPPSLSTLEMAQQSREFCRDFFCPQSPLSLIIWILLCQFQSQVCLVVAIQTAPPAKSYCVATNKFTDGCFLFHSISMMPLVFVS